MVVLVLVVLVDGRRILTSTTTITLSTADDAVSRFAVLRDCAISTLVVQMVKSTDPICSANVEYAENVSVCGM